MNPTRTDPNPPGHHPATAIVLCGVMELEVAAYAAQCPNIVHVQTLPQGLHNDPPLLRTRVQAAIDDIEKDPRIEAIALVYGLCSRGTEGLHAQRCTLILPRAHDCITLLLGCRVRYADYVAQNPGTYWYSPGWNKHHTPPGPERYTQLRAQYASRYGEDNADYLMESEQHWFSSYTRAAYVHLTIGATSGDKAYTQRCAKWLGWEYDEQAGDSRLLRDLLGGRWDDDRFLVLPPGMTARMTADAGVVEAVPVITEQRVPR